jgi:hypothetical protein
MGGLKLAGWIWIVAGVNSAGTVFGTFGEPIMVLFIGGAIVGLAVGSRLVTRPDLDAVRWSNIAGLAWLMAFGALTVAEVVMQMGYALSVAVHTALGVAGALLAYRRRAAVASS